MKMIKFANTDEAIQHLSDLTGKRVKIAFDKETEARKIYDQSLKDTDSWNSWGLSEKFPDSNGSQALQAAQFVVDKMTEAYSKDYPPENWWIIEGRLRSEVFAGLT